MSLLTTVLKLFKYNPDTDATSTFNIDLALNDNWDKIDAEVDTIRKTFADPVFDKMTIGARKALSIVGEDSFSSGGENDVSGKYAVAAGYANVVPGEGAFAEGGYHLAIGKYSHTEGEDNIAATPRAHVEGRNGLGVASTNYKKVTAFDNTLKKLTLDSVAGLAVGNTVYIKVDNTSSVKTSITAINGLVVTIDTTATINANWVYVLLPLDNDTSTVHVEGRYCLASGPASHAEGYVSKALGNYSHSEGFTTIASGEGSHAEGRWSTASNYGAHAEGTSTIASGSASHAEGSNTEATNSYSHAEGYGTKANGASSHAEGQGNEANGDNSHAGGFGSIASAIQSFVHGYGLRANGPNQAVFGQFNAPNITDLLQVGIGNSDSNRKNAFRINAVGDVIGSNGYLVKIIDATYSDIKQSIAATLPYLIEVYGFGTYNIWYANGSDHYMINLVVADSNYASCIIHGPSMLAPIYGKFNNSWTWKTFSLV